MVLPFRWIKFVRKHTQTNTTYCKVLGVNNTFSWPPTLSFCVCTEYKSHFWACHDWYSDKHSNVLASCDCRNMNGDSLTHLRCQWGVPRNFWFKILFKSEVLKNFLYSYWFHMIQYNTIFKNSFNLITIKIKVTAYFPYLNHFLYTFFKVKSVFYK